MDIKDLKVGDVVYLNSAPEILMTVESWKKWDGADLVKCYYFNTVTYDFSWIELKIEMLTKKTH